MRMTRMDGVKKCRFGKFDWISKLSLLLLANVIYVEKCGVLGSPGPGVQDEARKPILTIEIPFEDVGDEKINESSTETESSSDSPRPKSSKLMSFRNKEIEIRLSNPVTEATRHNKTIIDDLVGENISEEPRYIKPCRHSGNTPCHDFGIENGPREPNYNNRLHFSIPSFINVTNSSPDIVPPRPYYLPQENPVKLDDYFGYKLNKFRPSIRSHPAIFHHFGILNQGSGHLNHEAPSYDGPLNHNLLEESYKGGTRNPWILAGKANAMSWGGKNRHPPLPPSVLLSDSPAHLHLRRPYRHQLPAYFVASSGEDAKWEHSKDGATEESYSPPSPVPIRYHYDAMKLPFCAFKNRHYYNLTFCLQDPEYPRNDMIKTLMRNPSLSQKLLSDIPLQSADVLVDGVTAAQEESYDYKHYFGSNHLSHSRLEKYNPPYRGYTYRKDYFVHGGYICPSDVYYGRPKRAMNTLKQWKIIVNLEDISEDAHNGLRRKIPKAAHSWTQTVRLEQCIYPKAPCSYVNQKIHSQCIQKNAFVRMVAWTPKEGLHIDSFVMPSACSCHVKY